MAIRMNGIECDFATKNNGKDFWNYVNVYCTNKERKDKYNNPYKFLWFTIKPSKYRNPECICKSYNYKDCKYYKKIELPNRPKIKDNNISYT